MDGLLRNLDARLLILTCDPSVLEERIVRRQSPGWRKYISRYGDTDAAIVNHYLRQQEALVELSSRSRLPCRVMDVTDRSPSEMAAEAWDYLSGHASDTRGS